MTLLADSETNRCRNIGATSQKAPLKNGSLLANSNSPHPAKNDTIIQDGGKKNYEMIRKTTRRIARSVAFEIVSCP